METAIPKHLLRERSRQPRAGGVHEAGDGSDQAPVHSSGHSPGRVVGRAVVPRFAESVTAVSVVYLGLQHQDGCCLDQVAEAQAWLTQLLQGPGGPGHYEVSVFTDGAGHANVLFACYWLNHAFNAWWQGGGDQWTRSDALFPGIGRYAEIFQPTVDRIEAITDGIELHGLSRLAGEVSGPVREQSYWGAMRDRMALSQTDAMAAVGSFSRVSEGSLVRVLAPANLCVIRTGQDWSGGDSAEQADYLAKVEPTMKASTDLLDSSGLQFGCLCNRYAWLQDQAGTAKAATFGMSIWRSLAHLERWAEGHFNHLASYVSSVKHAERYGAATRLSRYHEVLVPAAEQMVFEYRNCHGGTGLLMAA